MFNDKLGQISLERVKRKSKQNKKRKTQEISNFVNVNSYSLDAFKRYTSGFFTIAGDSVSISYENENPENIIEKNTGFSYGNIEKDSYKSFDDSLIQTEDKSKNMDRKTTDFFTSVFTKKEVSNARYDILKRCPDITILTEGYPFPKENTDYLKCNMGSDLYSKNTVSQVFENIYEDIDSKDPFVDSQSLEISNGVYIVNKNYYNKGKIKPFTEKSNVRSNSIIQTENENNKYNSDHRHFKTSGFVYKSKRPDSIAFGGLKR
jgi:hypothetical protein